MSTEENRREPEENAPGDPGEPAPDEVSAENSGVGKPEETEQVEPEGGEEVLDPEEGVSEDPEESRTAELEAALEQTTAERDGYYDALLRMRAEFENSKKRMERERERTLQTASERILVALLPVLDNLERALDSEGDVREGVRATRDQLVAVLDGEGLAPVDSDGEHFDPNVHEAVMSQPSEEHDEGVVIQTFERGYSLNGKTVRVAKVVVSQ